MQEINAKERIFQAAIGLVISGEDSAHITVRKICSQAGVNPAMVSYYYKSKENLLGQVIGEIMGDLVHQSKEGASVPKDALEKLRNMLISTSEAAFENVNVYRLAISKELKDGCKNSSEMVTTFLREIYEDASQSELEIIAMQLMIPFHHIFLEPELYGRLLGTDFFDEEKRNQKIRQMIDCALAGLPRKQVLGE